MEFVDGGELTNVSEPPSLQVHISCMWCSDETSCPTEFRVVCFHCIAGSKPLSTMHRSQEHMLNLALSNELLNRVREEKKEELEVLHKDVGQGLSPCLRQDSVDDGKVHVITRI